MLCAKWAGKIVKLSNKDHTKTEIVIKGKILHIAPIWPSTASIGEKVAIVVKTAKKTGVETWVAALTAASLGSIPLSLNNAIFSPTTTASSTTMPRTRINVNKDNILIERSRGDINQNPPINDIGIPSETQNANFGFKNIANTTTTNNKPW